MHIGENIRKIRLSKNLTQEAVAKSVGISVTAYGDIERGCTDNITVKRLEQIAKTLDVSCRRAYKRKAISLYQITTSILQK